MDILTLSRKGLTQRAIVRRLGISRTTVKKYLENPELALAPQAKRNRKSQLDPFSDNIEAWGSTRIPFTALPGSTTGCRAWGFAAAMRSSSVRSAN